MLEDVRVPDQGPWTVSESPAGQFSLFSEDFHHDATLRIGGDFGDARSRKRYAEYLADVLTRGCARARAAVTVSPDDLLVSLSRLAERQAVEPAQARELLAQAADELAQLRNLLAEADQALAQLTASSYLRKPLQQSQALSPFAQALQAALGKKSD